MPESQPQQPLVPASSTMKEFTFRSVALGVFMAMIMEPRMPISA